MTTLVAHRDTPVRRYRRVPWSPRAWSDALFLAAAVPAQGLALATVVIPWAGAWHGHPTRRWLLIPLTLVLVSLATPLLTRIQRHRLRTTAGVDIPRQPKQDWQSLRGIVGAIRSEGPWRQLGYHLLAAPLLAAATLAAVGMWLGGLLGTFSLTYGWQLPDQRLVARGAYPAPVNHLPRVLGLQADVFLTLAGIAALAAAPWLTAGIRSLDVSLARTLLGPSRAEELEHQVEHLTQTRAGVVDAADAERRRLERDLHDGTQQRLVSLAMNLGMARAQATNADEARQAIAEAHEEPRPPSPNCVT